MSRQNNIESILNKHVNIHELTIINESNQHNVPAKSETHFKVIIISDDFENQTLVQRHQLINQALKEEFATGLHALAIHAHTPKEWQAKAKKVMNSPNCLGGSKK